MKAIMQKLFDRAANHLLNQGEISRDGEQCLYRGPDGLMCAVGCLIDDDSYNETLEDCNVGDDGVWEALVNSNPELSDLDERDTEVVQNMLQRLQSIHDQTDPEEWAKELQRTANRFGLSHSATESP